MTRNQFEKNPPIIGQEAICPDGLGRVRKIHTEFPFQGIQVDTYINNRCCMWDLCNVSLIKLDRE